MNDSADSVAAPQQVRATFASPAQMQDAVTKLSMSGFDRADLSLPSREFAQGMDASETGVKPVSTDSDARQARTLGASTAASAAAMAAAGITIATGGAAVPALAAAVLAGGAIGGSVFAIHRTADHVEQADREDKAATGDLVLLVRAVTEMKRSEAESILRAAGATLVEMD